jgi:hypothetical protein
MDLTFLGWPFCVAAAFGGAAENLGVRRGVVE